MHLAEPDGVLGEKASDSRCGCLAVPPRRASKLPHVGESRSRPHDERVSASALLRGPRREEPSFARVGNPRWWKSRRAYEQPIPDSVARLAYRSKSADDFPLPDTSEYHECIAGMSRSTFLRLCSAPRARARNRGADAECSCATRAAADHRARRTQVPQKRPSPICHGLSDCGRGVP